MIKSLHIKNFQSHKDTTLEFDPGVNIILGRSDSGKTAILRALRWLVWNRPSGEAFRSYWGGGTSVTLETESGSITRSKDKIEEYVLSAADQFLVFHAFKTDIPAEISKFLNMGEINIQQQLDSPFLLSKTAGEVASHFNRVAKLDKIDLSIQNVQKVIREVSQDIKHKKDLVDKLTEDLAKLPDLEKFEMEVEVLEDLEEQKTNLINSKGRLSKIIISLKKINNEITEGSIILKAEEAVNQIFDRINERDSLKDSKSSLEDIINTFSEIEETKASYEKILMAENLIESLLLNYEKVKEYHKDYKSLNRLVESLYALNKQLETIKSNIKKWENTFSKEMPSICPLCGTDLDKKKHAH